ncbi:MAG: hypothetical protein U5J95_06125 [Balneolaceae bacterium]|nr:hypothetical protein [Balneolaceae bacterium]
MTVRVKPDDPDFVLIGGTNLFRSTDGFATAPSDNSQSEKNKFWVGGYAKANDISQYPEQHADQHEIVFDPSDPNRVWVGHDGGLSVSNDIAASSVTWTDKNNGYVVTQYYDVSIPENENDNRLMGGTQDNGTTFFEFDRQLSETLDSQDISFADGGYSFFTDNYIIVSNQNK